jgi:hypothetical protein
MILRKAMEMRQIQKADRDGINDKPKTLLINANIKAQHLVSDMKSYF